MRETVAARAAVQGENAGRKVMSRWGRIVLALCTLWLGVAQAEWQGRMSENEAIDRAGMQRMLSQRILKAYCELGLSEPFGDPQAQLTLAVNLFDANLLQLESFVKEGEMKEALLQVKRVWPAYKDMAQKSPTREGAKKLWEINQKLLPLTHDVVVKMESGYGTSAGKWVNLAGRQRMLSQRIAMLYLLGTWGVGGPEEMAAADKAVQEYRTALDTLKTYERNTKETKKILDNLDSQFFLLQKAKGEKENLSFLIATTSEKMLEYADQLTGIYAEMDKK